MTPCEAKWWDDVRCGIETENVITVACVHGHVKDVAACLLHTFEGRADYIFCGECWGGPNSHRCALTAYSMPEVSAS